MRTVILDIEAMGYQQAQGTLPRRKKTAGDLAAFMVTQYDKFKADIIRTIRPMLQRAGFVYGSDLWKFRVKLNPYSIVVWVTLKFEDTNNEGKTRFMSMIKKTGLLEYSDIIKSYG